MSSTNNRNSILYQNAEITLINNNDKTIHITIEEFNDHQWFAGMNLDIKSAIKFRDFLNEFIEENNDQHRKKCFENCGVTGI